MGKSAFLAAIFILATVAGCIQAPQDAATLQDASSDPLLTSLGAIAPPTNVSLNGTWYVVPITVSPEGGLAAFEWTIPTGALVPWGYNDVFDQDEHLVALEIALLGDVPVDTWGMVLFEEGKDGLEAAGGYLSFAATSIQYTAMNEVTHEEDVRTTDFLSVGFDMKEGQLLRGLAIARGSEMRDAAVAFRVLDHDPEYPDSTEEPAGTPADFLQERSGIAPYALTVRAAATGFVFHGYVDVLLGGPQRFGIESVLGEPAYEWSVDRQQRAVGGPQSFVGSIASTYPHGFDVVDAAYFSIATGVTSYTTEVMLHDEKVSTTGRSPGLGLVGLLAGLPITGGSAYGWGDGEGETYAKLAVDRLDADAFVAVTTMSMIELGATAEELFGKASEHVIEAPDDGAPLSAPILTPRGIVQTGPTGARWTYALPGYAALQKL